MVEVKAGLLRNVDSQRLAALVSQRTRRNMIIHPTQTGTHVVFCDSVAKLRRTLQSHTISAIVCDLRDGIDDGLMATLQWASSLDTSPTLSVFLSLRQREVRHLLTLLADGLRVRALVWEHQQIGDDADYIAPGVDTIGAASRVLPRIIDVIPPGAEEIVVGAILLGGRRRSVGSLASACGISQRTLERRINSAGLPPIRRLLGWSLVLDAMFRIDVLGWSVKHAASTSGFENRDALANYVARQTGRTISLLQLHGGFDRLLREFRELLENAKRAAGLRSGPSIDTRHHLSD